MDTLKLYVDNLAQIKELEEQNKTLQKAILDELEAKGEALKTEFGTFSKVVRKSYKFTERVLSWTLPQEILAKKAVLEEEEKEATKELDAMKEEEINSGAAEVQEAVSMRFTPKKD